MTEAERRVWQLQAHAVLATVLTSAHVAGLPVLTWSVTDHGVLSAQIDGHGLPDHLVRDRFSAWVAFLGLDEGWFPVPGGTRTLRALGTVRSRDGHTVALALTASPTGQAPADPGRPDPAGEGC
ncbi:hypothetical protein [Amycolatopsis panacis]|uniref:hypothetical protein n=1 Tax=Amycolatopsis panacis TaxID=2340917 RepID=UPI0011C46F1C|nr:hypothetical protein [Amycolatopsis panacis]